MRPILKGFLNCWRDGPQPDVLDLNDDGDYGFSRGTGVSFPGSLGTTESSDDEMDDVSTPPIASSVPNSSVSRRWTQQEVADRNRTEYEVVVLRCDCQTEALRAGIAEFGHGSWHLIQADPRWASLLAGRRRSSMIRKWARMNKTRGTSDSGTNAPSTPSAPSHVGDFASDRDRRILAQAVAQAAAQPLHSLHQPPQPVHRVPGNDWTPEELVALRNAIVRHKGSWESAWVFRMCVLAHPSINVVFSATKCSRRCFPGGTVLLCFRNGLNSALLLLSHTVASRRQ